MNKLKKFKANFKVKLWPSIIITVCAVVLLSGGYYTYAAWNSTVGTGQSLTITLWNDVVAKLVELENRTNPASASPRMTCETVDRDAPADCNTTCANDGYMCIIGSEHGATNFHGYIRDCRATSDTPSCRCCRVSF